jgi:hypothetical protein
MGPTSAWKRFVRVVGAVSLLCLWACGDDGTAASGPDAGDAGTPKTGDAGGSTEKLIDAAVSPQASMCALMRPQRVGACVLVEPSSEEDAGVPPFTAPAEVAITGKVLEITRGPWGCEGLGMSAYPELGDRPWRFRLDDGSQQVWVGVVLPWRTPLLALGDEVSVTYSYSHEPWVPEASQLSIARADGTPLLWFSTQTSTDLLSPPGVTVQDADACTFDDGCSLVARRGFKLSVGEDVVSLGYGEQADVGSYVALHAGNDHQTTTTGGCPDYFLASSSLLLVRGSSAALADGETPPCANDSCQGLTCAAEAATAGEQGDCAAYWSCSGRNFSVQCRITGDQTHCECGVDGLVSSEFDGPRQLRCLSTEAAAACGFSAFGL